MKSARLHDLKRSLSFDFVPDVLIELFIAKNKKIAKHLVSS